LKLNSVPLLILPAALRITCGEHREAKSTDENPQPVDKFGTIGEDVVEECFG
jgi:hypothetical protein